MKIIQKQEIDVGPENIQIGDQIAISFDNNGGTYTATAHRIDENGILFMFDDCIAEHVLNEEWTNKGGFGASDMKCWLQDKVLPAFPPHLRSRIKDLSLPTYGMMFGHDKWYESNIKPDNDKQLQLMRKRKNRVADFEGDYKLYWLKNAVVPSEALFASVDVSGAADHNYASYSLGVRPVFTLDLKSLTDREFREEDSEV